MTQNFEHPLDELWKMYEANPSINNMFLLSYRMEFYLLHPSFEILFRYMKMIGDNKSPETEYDDHLNIFVYMLEKYANITPEIELLGETIQTLWQKNKDLADQCFIDDPTRVCNRKGFFHAAKPLTHLAQRTSRSISGMMIDIDDFKKINDTYGHQKGDEILKDVGRKIESNLRSSDVVGRYGGEEFVVFLNDIDRTKAEKIAEKIRLLVAKEPVFGIPTTISIGLSVGEIEFEATEALISFIDKADNCLYQAKKTGKNRVVSSC